MKALLLILASSLLMFSCQKTSTPPPTTNNPNPKPQIQYYDLKYWFTDTFEAVTTSGTIADTLYGMTINGKNYIKYKGVQYQFRCTVVDGDTFSDSTGRYFYDLFDMSGNYI